MFLRVLLLISAFVFAQHLPAFSMQALTVKPEDVYSAAYCAELNRLAQYPKVSIAYDTRSETVLEPLDAH